MRWQDLEPTAEVVAALEYAGLPRPEDGDQNAKRAWSEKFADGCAAGIASLLRQTTALRKKTVRPLSLSGGTEPLTPLGSGTSKRIDVTVADPVLGLEIGVSLKGLNFRDGTGENYDKNLTGRLYELGDEVRVVHEHLPHAFMVGVFFLPLASSEDKATAPSSFANAMSKLAMRTGRLDAALMGQAGRCDAAYVGLYAIGNERLPYRRGVVRFMNVSSAPPRRGRPRIDQTLSLFEVVAEIVAKATNEERDVWAEPETD